MAAACYTWEWLTFESQVPETTIILSADFTSVSQHRTAAAFLTDIPSLE